MSNIRFQASISQIGSWTLLRLPESVSKSLPSRGATLIEGTLKNVHFLAVLEPDGKKSHWFKLDEPLIKAAEIKKGDVVELQIEPSKAWPEPAVPSDITKALRANQTINALWMDITPMARWDWIRWIRSTKNPETRKRRIEVAFDKLQNGERRPCCFNRNLCTEPEISHNGILLEPS